MNKPLLVPAVLLLALAASACSPSIPEVDASIATTASTAPTQPAAEPVPTAPAMAEGDDGAVAGVVAPEPSASPAASVTEAATTNFQAQVGKGVAQAVSLSTNAQAHAYAGVLASITGEMLDTDPDTCARLLMPETFGAASFDKFTTEQRERFSAAQRVIFATAQDAPTPAPPEEEAGPLYDTIAMGLEARHGADALAGLDGNNVPAATTCRAWQRLYSGIAAAPAEDGGRVMRWLNAP